MITLHGQPNEAVSTFVMKQGRPRPQYLFSFDADGRYVIEDDEQFPEYILERLKKAFDYENEKHIDDMGRKELFELAKQKGIEFDARIRNSTLREMIKERS